MITDHFLLMLWLAVLISAFLTVLWKDQWRERRQLFLKLFATLFLGALALGWLLYAKAQP